MLGCAPVDEPSTYRTTAPGPGALDAPFRSVSVTSTDPVPSWGGGAPGGTVAEAGGNVAMFSVALRTAMSRRGIVHVPTVTSATSSTSPDWKPVPVMVTRPPEVGRTDGS